MCGCVRAFVFLIDYYLWGAIAGVAVIALDYVVNIHVVDINA